MWLSILLVSYSSIPSELLLNDKNVIKVQETCVLYLKSWWKYNIKDILQFLSLFHAVFLSKVACYSSASHCGPRSLRNSSVVLQGSIEDFYLTVKLSHHLQTGVFTGQRRPFLWSFRVERRKSICSFKNNCSEKKGNSHTMGHFIITYRVCYSNQAASMGFSMPCIKQKAFFPMENNVNNWYIHF